MVKIEDANKLASHVRQLGEEAGVSLKAYKVALEHMASAERAVGPKGDLLGGIYGAVRFESGLDYENGASP